MRATQWSAPGKDALQRPLFDALFIGPKCNIASSDLETLGNEIDNCKDVCRHGLISDRHMTNEGPRGHCGLLTKWNCYPFPSYCAINVPLEQASAEKRLGL